MTTSQKRLKIIELRKQLEEKGITEFNVFLAPDKFCYESDRLDIIIQTMEDELSCKMDNLPILFSTETQKGE